MKILHFADLHIGMENYGRFDPQRGLHSRVRDFVDRLDEVCAYAFDHQADMVLFAGDAFKTRDPDPTQLREFARRIKKLAERVPVFILVGNHDLPAASHKATSVDIFDTLDVPNVIVGRAPGHRLIQTASGPLFLAWVSFPVRNRLLTVDDTRGLSVEAVDGKLALFTHQALSAQAEAAAQHLDVPRVLAGHFTVHGAQFGSERAVMLGRDLAVAYSALSDPVWNYVALGHIHKHQNLTPADAPPLTPPVVYAGSLERIDFGERDDPKGFCWVDIDPPATRWQFVPVNARPFVEIRVDARHADDPTAAVLKKIGSHHLEGAVVRVSVRLREEQEPQLRKRDVEAALSAADFSAGVALQVERQARPASVGLDGEALTPVQWVERFARHKNYAPEFAAQVVQAAEQVMQPGEAA